MKILHLTLKKKWFDMIASGEKKEEYREVKPYWINRLTWHEYHGLPTIQTIHALSNHDTMRRDFDAIEFKNGYGKNSPKMLIELEHIYYGYPSNPKWLDGNPDNWYFVLKLGKILKTN